MNDSSGLDDPRIAALTDPSLGPMFWRPSRLGVDSAWYGHVPFAHWLVSALRPASIVELGAHNGVSYAAFCEAVLREQLDARCLAIDTWQGDKHAGFYGDDVLADLQRFHDARYAGFSTLLRSTFDDAAGKVADGSVDLLHIDGRHEYGDVSHDFATWRAKVSPRGVVLFHDTNVRTGDFGVWRLWDELRGQYPSFEFLHGHGLGVLAVGGKVGGAVATLCQLHDGRDVNAVRERFALLGERWIAARDLIDQTRFAEAAAADMAATRAWADKAQAEVNRLFPLHGALSQSVRESRLALATMRHDLAARERDLAALESTRDQVLHEHGAAQQDRNDMAARLDAVLARDAALTARLEKLEAHAAALESSARAQIEALYAQRTRLLQSASWRLTAPLRALRGSGRITADTRYDLPQLERLPDLPEPPLLIQHADAANDGGGAPDASQILFVSGEEDTPGNAYRIENFVKVAQALGYKARWMPVHPIGPADLVGLRIIFIWRVPYSNHVRTFIDICRSQGTLVIYDVDDLMFRPELATVKIIDGIRSRRFSELQTQAFFTLIASALKDCDVVTCPTEELAHEARGLGRPACVLPNGFDWQTHDIARRARIEWAQEADDRPRIGYAAGSRTHQRDFAVAAPAVARVLREIPQAVLVVFRDPASGEGVVLLNEFPEFADLAAQIEWRDMVPLADLPKEMARFTVNIAPLEADNPFCEAKSELKYFEAALAGVPTIASGTGPYRRAINNGVTGLIASSTAEWHSALTMLLADPALRVRMAQAAYHDALAYHGPDAQADAFSMMLAQALGGADGAAAFERARYRDSLLRVTPPEVPDSDIVWRSGRGGEADVTVIVPVYNYADYLVEALASVAAQTLQAIDLVIIDDASPDDSGDMAILWLKEHGGRFNRVTLLRHRANAGLGRARNSGFAAAETRFVLPLDADNRLHPNACAHLLAALTSSRAAFAYPAIQEFGAKNGIFGNQPYTVLALAKGNYIDAMALVRKSAWAAAGGYENTIWPGFEDFDFWCRLAERGQYGLSVPEILADYRVHASSMLHTTTDVSEHKRELVDDMNRRHPWLDLRA
jgi:GT2 family glycosyltransferase/glycosyltransferase involved in cell wall biosynthesis